MRYIIFLFTLSFCNAQDQDLLRENLVGNWNICSVTQFDVFPTFLSCMYEMNFNESGKYEVYDKLEDKLVGRGKAELLFYKEINSKKLYKLNRTFDGIMGFKLDDYFPNNCVVSISNSSLTFLTNDAKDIISPYFLKKE